MITISGTEFPRGQSRVTITVSDTGITDPVVSVMQGMRISSNGQSWSDYVMLDSGENKLYIRVTNAVPYGVNLDAIQWQYRDELMQVVEGAWDITVTGGEPNHYATLQMTLSPRASTIRYNANLVKGNATLGGGLSGTILDYNYLFEVEQIQESGTRKQISGSAYASKLVNRLIIYQVKYEFQAPLFVIMRPTFRDHLDAISQEIGMPIVYYGLDFYPKTNINVAHRKNPLSLSFYEVITGDFASILQNLIGFTSDIPNLVIDLYIENNTIYLIQRGYETNTRTPANWVSAPTLSYTIRHTEWGNSSTQQVVPKEISSSDAVDNAEPFTGTITWGSGQFQTTMNYEDGYLQSQVTGDTTTVYTYTDISNGKYLTQKVATTVDSSTQQTTGVVTTVYRYETTANQLYLHEEEYTAVDEVGDTTEHRLTKYTPAYPGWYGVDVYDLIEGEQISSNLSNGAPGQKANQYLVDKFNNNLKDRNTSQRPVTVALNGVAKARQQYPVANLESFSGGFGLRQIAAALDLYEGKTEVMLTGEIVGDSHLYNYLDKIVYNGEEYYLVSNNITQSATGVRQSITAVRWILPQGE